MCAFDNGDAMRQVDGQRVPALSMQQCFAVSQRRGCGGSIRVERGQQCAAAFQADGVQWLSEQIVQSVAKHLGRGSIGVDDGACRQGDEQNHLPGKVEQGAETLKPGKVAAQFGVVTLAKRAFAETDDAVPLLLPRWRRALVRGLQHRSS